MTRRAKMAELRVEEVVLGPATIHDLTHKTGISYAELDLRYMTAMDNGDRVVYTIKTKVSSRTEKK
jgi:hypothetical protein